MYSGTFVSDLYNGKAKIEKTMYLVEFLGDLPRYLGFDAAVANTLEDAIRSAEKWASKPDPEDDRILVWEILPSGHKKVVWHFSGWHWDSDEFGLDQGKYLGHEKSLYEECIEEY
jgi:hypothetical protein